MGSARREIKAVAFIALLAVAVAVAAAVFLSTSLSGQIEGDQASVRGLRQRATALTDKVETAEEHAEDLDTANGSLKSGYKQCQRALELTEEFVMALFDLRAGASDADIQKVDDLATRADKSSGICMATRVDLVDTY